MARLTVRAQALQPPKSLAVTKPIKPTKPIHHLSAIFLANAGAASAALADQLSISYPEVTLPAVDASAASAASDIASLFSDNPLLIGGGAALVAIPVAIGAFLNSGAGAGGVKATNVERTLQALAEDPRVVLVDIRSKADIKAQGSPDLKSVKRSPTSLPFTSVVKGEVVVDEKFADKLGRLRNIKEDSLVILLDADGRVAKKAAAAVADVVEKVYYVQGGAEAWAETGPWKQPGAGLSFSLPSVNLNLKSVGANINELAEDFKKAPSLTKAGLAAGALFGAAFLLANEVEVILELAGILAAGNFLLKFVFADEREKTLTEIRTLVDEKVAIKEVGSDLNKIAKAVLEDIPEGSSSSSNGSSAEPTPANVQEAKEW